MKLKIVKAGEALQKGHTHAKILIWGNSGTGTSWLAATAPNPLIVLTEPNGAVSIGHSNPNADIVPITSITDLRNIVQMAKTGKLDKYDTLIFDSLTECQRLFKDEILGDRDQLKIQEWNTLATRMLGFIRVIRDLPFHVVCTALQGNLQDSEGTIILNCPQFEGRKTANEIMQYFSAVGYLFGREQTVVGEDEVERKELVRHLVFEGSAKYMIKPCYPLTKEVDPNLTTIINKITNKG